MRQQGSRIGFSFHEHSDRHLRHLRGGAGIGLARFYELVKPRMNLLILGTTTVGFSIAAKTTADSKRCRTH